MPSVAIEFGRDGCGWFLIPGPSLFRSSGLIRDLQGIAVPHLCLILKMMNVSTFKNGSKYLKD